MRAYRETFRRHRVLYLLPALLAAVAIGALSYKAPTYMATASLWVDNEASSTSSLNVTPDTNQSVTPASAEQVVLTELLATAKFDSAVLSSAGAGSANSPSISLSTAVTSSTPGPQVLQVTCIGPSPAIAHNIVGAVITQLRKFNQQWSHTFATSAVAYYQAQVNSATHAVAQAKATSGSSQSVSVGAAMSALTTASSALSQAQAQANGSTGFSTVMLLGQPTASPAALTGYKSLMMKTVGAAAAALLLSALVIVLRTPGGQDRWDDEMSSGPDLRAARWGHPSGATSAGPVDARAPMTASGPAMAAQPAAQASVSQHRLRMSGLVLRRTPMQEADDAQADSPPAADSARA